MQNAKIQTILKLKKQLDSNTKLFEIGLKHADRNEIRLSVEETLQSRLEEIGMAKICNSTYTVFEEPKTGVLLATYTNEWDKWVIGNKKSKGIVISNNSYSGLIIPGYKLTSKIVQDVDKNLSDSATIEYPFNRLGAISIDDITKGNVEEDKKNWVSEFKLNVIREPKLKNLMVSSSSSD